MNFSTYDIAITFAAGLQKLVHYLWTASSSLFTCWLVVASHIIGVSGTELWPGDISNATWSAVGLEGIPSYIPLSTFNSRPCTQSPYGEDRIRTRLRFMVTGIIMPCFTCFGDQGMSLNRNTPLAENVQGCATPHSRHWAKGRSSVQVGLSTHSSSYALQKQGRSRRLVVTP